MTGGALHYLMKGSGPPLVILHHSIGNHGWLPLYERLSERYTVYVPDIPGFGKSERPDWARNVRDLAVQLHLMLDGLGLDRVTLMGFGFGRGGVRGPWLLKVVFGSLGHDGRYVAWERIASIRSRQVRITGGVPHTEFWARVEAENTAGSG